MWLVGRWNRRWKTNSRWRPYAWRSKDVVRQPGWCITPNRGVQYASLDYSGLLQQHGITISMSRKGNPYDNAFCESFMKTLKYEEVHREEYRNLAEARGSIERFLEQVYNGRRLHSALDYRPPLEFEMSLLPPSSLPLSQVTA